MRERLYYCGGGGDNVGSGCTKSDGIEVNAFGDGFFPLMRE